MPIDKNSGRRLSANKFKYGTKEDKIDFFKTYYPYAEQALNEYTPTDTVSFKDIKIPVETLLAQAYLESTGGRVMPKFNYSGVKSPEGSKKGYGLYKTTEYFDTPDQYETMEFDGKVILDTVKYKPRKPGEYRNLYSVEEVKEGKNAGRYKYSVDDYFFEGEDAVDAFKHTINNFYVTPQYKEALKAETVSDPDLFLKAIAPSYSTSKSYYETTSPIVADMKEQTDIIKQQNIDAENLIKQQQVQDTVNNILPEMITDSLSNKVLPKGKIPFSNVFNVPKLKDGAKNVYGKVEAQGGELVVRNTSGDYAVIPKEKRVDALRLMSEKNNYGLDELIAKLPKMGDYAANGLVIGSDDPPFSSFAPSKYKHVNVESGSKNKDGWIDKKDVRGTTMVNGQEQTVYGYPNTTKPTGYDRTITEIPKNNIPPKVEHENEIIYVDSPDDPQYKEYLALQQYNKFAKKSNSYTDEYVNILKSNIKSPKNIYHQDRRSLNVYGTKEQYEKLGGINRYNNEFSPSEMENIFSDLNKLNPKKYNEDSKYREYKNKEVYEWQINFLNNNEPTEYGHAKDGSLMNFGTWYYNEYPIQEIRIKEKPKTQPIIQQQKPIVQKQVEQSTQQQTKQVEEVKQEVKVEQPFKQQPIYQPKTNKYSVIKKEGYGFYDAVDKKEVRNYSAPGQNERKMPYYEIRFDDGTTETVSYENFMKYYKK